ncbi:hypothetical protein [Fusibacter sp. 3D3]|nr:hypothetical protein [Fusibacter sp. 3D3]GAU75521.1 hypothetical protein F3D3_0112 [Fusibacter sp. 3D3]
MESKNTNEIKKQVLSMVKALVFFMYEFSTWFLTLYTCNMKQI